VAAWNDNEVDWLELSDTVRVVGCYCCVITVICETEMEFISENKKRKAEDSDNSNHHTNKAKAVAVTTASYDDSAAPPPMRPCESGIFAVTKPRGLKECQVRDAISKTLLWSGSTNTHNNFCTYTFKPEQNRLFFMASGLEGTLVGQLDITTGLDILYDVPEQSRTRPHSLSISHHGNKCMALLANPSTLCLWTTSEASSLLSLQEDLVANPVFGYDDSCVISLSFAGKLCVWDSETLAEIGRYDDLRAGHKRWPLITINLEASATAPMVAGILNNEPHYVVIMVWNYLSGEREFRKKCAPEDACSACFGPRENTLLIFQTEAIEVYDIEEGELLRTFPTNFLAATGHGIDYAHNTILTVTGLNTVTNIDFDTGHVLSITSHDDMVCQVCSFNPGVVLL
jgi:hypothetical protein